MLRRFYRFADILPPSLRSRKFALPSIAAALVLAVVPAFMLTPSPVMAQSKGKKVAAAGNEPKLVVTSGEWGVYVARSGKSKTCYALGRPKKRMPASLKRDDGFVFITMRPGEGVRNEVSIIMGFDVKDNSGSRIQVGAAKFEMHSKGGNLWIKNAAEERNFVAAIRKGAEMSVHAKSRRGNDTTDTYSLSGISNALDRVQAECK